MKTLGMAIVLALVSASFAAALGPWDSDTARGAGSLEAQGRAGGLMVRWEPPATLPTDPLVGYQLRHRPQTTSQTPAAWTTVDVGDVRSHRISGLQDGTAYEVEVATRTAQGVGTFYASTTGTPGASQCESGTAVSDPANNSGLVEDCEVLLAARDTLAGTGTLNWSASTPVSSWQGIGVSPSPSRVTILDLTSNQLTGSIPGELGQLSNLRTLRLYNNELTGSIPVELGQLSNLWTLDLHNNELTGSIPGELGQLSNLTGLSLSDNELTGSIPAELGQLSNLRTLRLYNNELTGSIPVELGQLSNLWTLDLHNNELTGSIPGELGQLSNLTGLSLSDNELTGSIPVELGQLSNLTSLSLRFNELTGSIPVELAQLSNLESLLLQDNQLTGLIPHQLAQLSNLGWLHLADNQFTPCVPAALRAITSNDLWRLALPDCPVVTITPGPSAVVEGTATSFTVTRIGTALTSPLTVSVTVSESGSVISGTAPSSVVILTGQTSATLTIATVDDTVSEADSVITVTIADDSSYSLDGDSSVAQVRVTDDDQPTVTIAANGSPVDEGANASFTLTRTGDTTASLVVSVGVTETGATITGTPPSSVTIPAGQTSATLTVPTEDDAVPEDDSVVTATLSAGTLYDLGDDSSAEVTVRDDDPLVSFMAPDDIIEGENAVFTFERVGGVSHELVVSVSVPLTGDFLSGPAPTTVTFTADSTTAELSIPTVDDSTPEADGNIAVLLRQGGDYDITGTLLQQVSVQDNDRPTVTVTAVASPFDEGGSAVFRVTATGGVILQALEVPIAVSESGTMFSAGTPLPTSASVTLTATRRSVDISIAIADHTDPESDRVVTATLSDGPLYDLGDDFSATVTVTVRDDDPLVSFMAPDDIIEGENAVFTFERVGGVSHELVVSVSVPLTGDFLSGPAPTTVTFTADSTTAELSIPTVDDSTPEADGNIAVLLRQGGDYDITGTLLQQVSVQDNDRPTVTVTAVATPIDEGGNAVFRVTATGGVILQALTVPVTVSESDAMITAGTPLSTSATLTDSQRWADISIPTEDDAVPEDDSVVTATLSAGTLYDLGDDSSAEVTVRDDDPLVSFMAPDDIIEGENAVFTFKRVGGVSHELDVSVSVLLTGDFFAGPAPTTVTFTADSTTAELSIPTVDDSTPEADGNIAVLLRQGGDYDITGTLLQQVSVQDNDRPTVTVTAVATPIDEGGNAVFRVTATGGVILQALTVPVTVSESDAMITAGTPLSTSATLTDSQRWADISIPTEDDAVPEDDSVVTATLSAGTLYDLGDDSSAEVTVRDDDPLVSFMAPDDIIEGENAVFTFKRVGGVSHELDVSVSVLLTGDFFAGPAPTTVTFTADSTTAELSIPTVDDSTPEADGNIAVLLRQGGDYDITGTLLQQVSVQDNDRSTITIAVVSSTVEEGNPAVFRVTRTGGTTTEALTVAVTVSETGTMIHGTAPTSLTIAANQTSADLSVPTHEDKTAEVDSIITATLSGGSTYDLGTTASAAVTVTDDDLPGLTITFDDTSPIEEGTTASFTVTRTGVTTEALTINVSVLETGNMIDGTPPTTLVFAANEATAELDIDTDDDSVDEPDSTIFVGVTLPNERRSRTPPDLVSVVVTDND